MIFSSVLQLVIVFYVRNGEYFPLMARSNLVELGQVYSLIGVATRAKWDPSLWHGMPTVKGADTICLESLAGERSSSIADCN